MSYTILKKYKDLDYLIDDINRSINNKAINSYYLDFYCGIQKLASKIIDLMEAKRTLFNIKKIVDDAVAELDPLHKKIFELHFVQKINAPTIAEKLNINRMQAYRTIQSMPKKILPFLEKSSYFDEFCKVDCFKINYIKSAYEHYSEVLNKSIV